MSRFYTIMVAFLMAMGMVLPAFGGQEPYVALVGEDTAINPFYISPKLLQFTHECTNYPYPYLGETFRSLTPANKIEVCSLKENPQLNKNSLIRKGTKGYYEWYIVLPKDPEGNLNIVLQCGVLKPNSLATWGNDAVQYCAAETGEVIGTGYCTREPQSDVKNTALPTITAWAFAGPYNYQFAPFNLTAYKNPGSYVLSKDPVTGKLVNNGSLQVLNGNGNSRVVLKACMDKTIFVKMPKDGEVNALGQIEAGLAAGDMIYVRMDVPIANTVDIYCHKHSAKIMGIGTYGTLLPDPSCQ